MAKCLFFTDKLIINAYMEYLELRFSEIMQYSGEKRIYIELIPTCTSRDELGKLSGQRGQGRVKSTGKIELGLIEIKLQLLTPRLRRNITCLELYGGPLVSFPTFFPYFCLRNFFFLFT